MTGRLRWRGCGGWGFVVVLVGAGWNLEKWSNSTCKSEYSRIEDEA
jgi:hypothetical protein